MSNHTLSFFLALIVIGLLFVAVTIATTPRFQCDGIGNCSVE